MSDFRFFRDFGRIVWGPTLTLLAVRTVAAGLVWYVVLLLSGATGPSGTGVGNPLSFIVLWFAFALIAIPLARVVWRIIGAIVGMEWLATLMSALLSLVLVVGDPIVYLLARQWPALAPVEGFKPVNFEALIFALRPPAPIPVEVVGHRRMA